MLIYGISKDVLYSMIRKGLIPSYNFGQRLTRLSRQYMDEHFKIKAVGRKKKNETLLFEPKACYTIGEIAKKSTLTKVAFLSIYAVTQSLHVKSATMFMPRNQKMINYISRYEESITQY